MTYLLVVLACATALRPTVGAPDDTTASEANAFDNFIIKFDREYKPGSEEFKKRFAIFVRRSRAVHKHNAKGDALWNVEVNRFTDRTDDELGFYLGYRHHSDYTTPVKNAVIATSVVNLSATTGGNLMSATAGGHMMMARRAGIKSHPKATPNSRVSPDSTDTVAESVDWNHYFKTNHDYNLEVPDQLRCGSCWAVATTNVLNIWDQIVNKRPRDGDAFSAQEFVNCVPNPRSCGGTGGCQGATVELAMHWALEVGLSRLSKTPYTGKDHSQACPLKCADLEDADHPCKAESGGGSTFGLVGWNMLPRYKTQPLKRAVMDGPVGVTVAADPIFSYQSGIFGGCGPNESVNHAVTLVGYGKAKRTGYWHVMNSWGSSWGEKGYIRFLRELDDRKEEAKCGVDTKPLDGTGCEGGPPQVKTCGMCGLLYDNVRPYFSKSGEASANSEDLPTQWSSVTVPDTDVDDHLALGGHSLRFSRLS